MDAPTAVTVRDWATSNVGEAFDFGRYGYPPPEGSDPDRLERVVRSASAWVAVMSGRLLDSTLTDPNLVALAQDAVLMATQWALVQRGTGRQVRDALSNARLKSLRAGDYADTRRDFKEARDAGQIHPWKDLSDVILALATPERRAEMLAELTGKVRPVAITVNALRATPGSSYVEP
jgi:hypothetical protein